MNALQYKHADVPSCHYYHWMSYCSNVDAPLHVHDDVPLDVPVSWMFYDTYRRDMNAPQYVNTDVSSSYIYRWIYMATQL